MSCIFTEPHENMTNYSKNIEHLAHMGGPLPTDTFILIMYSSLFHKNRNTDTSRNSTSLHNRRNILRILGGQRRNRGEHEASVTCEERSALPLARDSRFMLASLAPLFAWNTQNLRLFYRLELDSCRKHRPRSACKMLWLYGPLHTFLWSLEKLIWVFIQLKLISIIWWAIIDTSSSYENNYLLKLHNYKA